MTVLFPSIVKLMDTKVPAKFILRSGYTIFGVVYKIEPGVVYVIADNADNNVISEFEITLTEIVAIEVSRNN